MRVGNTHLVMSPLDLTQRLAALVPRPLAHLIRLHGVLAPSIKLRALVVPQMQTPDTAAAAAATYKIDTLQARLHCISWARLIQRVFDIDMYTCPNCGAGQLTIIAAILERPGIEKFLTHLGLDQQLPPRGRARELGQD